MYVKQVATVWSNFVKNLISAKLYRSHYLCDIKFKKLYIT